MRPAARVGDAPAAGAEKKEKKQEKKVDEALELIRAELEAEEKESGGADVLNIAPKKPNWDLKRDIEKSLAILNRRTQRAIVELIRERLAREAEEEEADDDDDDDE